MFMMGLYWDIGVDCVCDICIFWGHTSVMECKGEWQVNRLAQTSFTRLYVPMFFCIDERVGMSNVL